MQKFYIFKNLTKEELNELARERNSLEQERDKYKQMYEMEKALFIDADLKIERAIDYINHFSKESEIKIYGLPNCKVFIGDAEQLLEILKGDKEC